MHFSYWNLWQPLAVPIDGNLRNFERNFHSGPRKCVAGKVWQRLAALAMRMWLSRKGTTQYFRHVRETSAVLDIDWQ